MTVKRAVRTAKIANAVKLTPVKPANAVKPVLATPASASPVPVILTRQSVEKNLLFCMQAFAPAGDQGLLLPKDLGTKTRPELQHLGQALSILQPTRQLVSNQLSPTIDYFLKQVALPVGEL